MALLPKSLMLKSSQINIVNILIYYGIHVKKSIFYGNFTIFYD
nr:MAG TPA: hypothetical protein [Caudoviricetes sp.]